MAEVSNEAQDAQALGNAAAIEILESASAGGGRHTYVMQALTADGTPMAGEDFTIRLVGDGSLAPNMASQQIRREADAKGSARFTWYRSSIYGRDVKAKLTVSMEREGAQVAVEEVDPERSSTSYDFIGKHKWRLR